MSMRRLLRSLSNAFAMRGPAPWRTAVKAADAPPADAPRLSEEERSRYSAGGYHPVRIGDEFANGKYRVLRKLGYGLFSTVWLANDTQTTHKVALKILTADAYDGKRDVFERAILQRITETAAPDSPEDLHVPGLLDDFQHEGPHGQHVCLVFKALGPDTELLRSYFPHRRLPIPMAKKVARDLLVALAFLHDSCGVIHTDIKPCNILLDTPGLRNVFRHAPPDYFLCDALAMPAPDDYYMASAPVVFEDVETTTPHDASFILGDVGVSSWTDNHISERIQPVKLRAPEVILGAAWDTKADIWNLGLVVWELTTGRLCFDGQATATADYSPEAHLAQMQLLLGRFPATLLARSGRRDRYFDSEGNQTTSVSFPAQTLASMCDGSGAFAGRDDMPVFLDFVASTLALEPQERPTAQALLGAAWLKDVP